MNVAEVESILSQVRSGRTEAFEEIVRLYQREVWKVAAAMLRDIATTENLVQQTFVNAYFNLDQFQPGADFGIWLKAIARNLVREELRKQSRGSEHLKHYHQYLAARLENDREHASAQDRMSEALRQCRGKLSPAAARVVELRYEQGVGFESLAKQLNRTIEATRQLLSRIRIELRNCVERRVSQP